MPNAVELWCWCLGLSALALIGLFFGFYGVECALLGWAISQVDVGDLNQMYLKRDEARESADAERPAREPIAAGLVLHDPRSNVIPLPVKRNRLGIAPRKRDSAAKAV
jgi:hypothetical protein